MSIYSEAESIAASGARVLVAVSRGRDSLVMVSVLLAKVPKDRLVFLHLQTYPGLLYQTQHLARIEARFGIQLEIQPSREQSKILTGKNPSNGFAKERDFWRHEYKCDYVAYGFRSDESVSRSVIMKQFPDGLNAKSGECYPLKRWNRSLVAKYALMHRLPMAVEYDYGYRDFSGILTGQQAVWLHDTFPDDYETAAAFDPFLAAEYTRATGQAS